MRGYFFIALLLSVFNFGCSSKEKTTTSDNVANELVELKISRKHKNERIIEAELKADLTLQKRKTPSDNKIEDLSSQIDRNIKAIISATLITSVSKKGIVPNQIVCKGVFCITPLITNKFIPTGGETNPNSTTITANIPNQTGTLRKLGRLAVHQLKRDWLVRTSSKV